MPRMATKRQNKSPVNWQSDWWLWPSALLLGLGGWGEALWTLGNVSPEQSLAPLTLLLWAGVGVAGVTLSLYWLSRRWWPIAWLTVTAWAAVPTINDMANDPKQTTSMGDRWYSISPLLLLLLLGVGLSGVMLTISWLAGRRWPGPAPDIRPLRQGFWSGFFAVVCGWLLINHAFSPVPVALLSSALVLIEAFFVTRESPH